MELDYEMGITGRVYGRLRIKGCGEVNGGRQETLTGEDEKKLVELQES
jgi:hypothetical protein